LTSSRWTIPGSLSYSPTSTPTQRPLPYFEWTPRVTPIIRPRPMVLHAPDTISGCLIYANAYDANTQGPVKESLNRCSYFAKDHQVTVSNLTTWNPSLDGNECALQPGYSYCVRQTNETYGKLSDDSMNLNPTSQEHCLASLAVTPSVRVERSNKPWCDKAKGQIVESTDTSCACFFNVYGYDSDSMLLSTSCRHMRDRVMTLTFS
jgi:hypothetical protein